MKMVKIFFLNLMILSSSSILQAKPGIFAKLCPCFFKNKYQHLDDFAHDDGDNVRRFIRVAVSDRDKKQSCFSKLKKYLGCR